MMIGDLAMSNGNRYQPDEERTEYVATGGIIGDEFATPEEVADRLNRWQSMAEHPAGKADPVSPNHYKGFSNGAEVIDITERLTFNTGNAVKYLARAGRTDGHNKGQIIEDLRKSLWYTQRELDRLGDNK